MVKVKSCRITIDCQKRPRICRTIGRIELDHVSGQILFLRRGILTQSGQRNGSDQIWVLLTKGNLRRHGESFALVHAHPNQGLLERGRELPSTHQQSGRLVVESAHDVSTLGQRNPVVQGQERVGGNFGSASHIRFSHGNILTSLEKSAQTSIKNWPEQSRPREKLLLNGPNSMNDAELLSIILRTGNQGENSLNLSHRLIQEFGSLSSILTASLKDFEAYKGIGISKWSQLQVIHELVQRSYKEKIKQQSILTSTDLVKSYLIGLIGQREYEVFVCLYLDIHLRLIDTHEIFRGSISETAVHIREIAKECLLRNASSLIIAHNHPSGSLKPSQEDITLTIILHEALQLIEVNLLDHCIVTKRGASSFLELKIMPFRDSKH
jgi:DNA repair protein RadC